MVGKIRKLSPYCFQKVGFDKKYFGSFQHLDPKLSLRTLDFERKFVVNFILFKNSLGKLVLRKL